MAAQVDLVSLVLALLLAGSSLTKAQELSALEPSDNSNCCKRQGTGAGRITEDFEPIFDPAQPFEANYEASLVNLTQIDQSDGGQIEALYNYGWLSVCPRKAPPSWTRDSSLVFQVENRLLWDGRHESRKRITSTTDHGSLVRELDQLTGQCRLLRMALPETDALLSFHFNPTGEPSRRIEIMINDHLLSQLAMQKRNNFHYELIESIAASKENNWNERRVFELRADYIWLGVSINAPGFIRITRERAYAKRWTEMSHFKAEIILPERLKLTLRFESIKLRSCLSLLRQSQPEQCYQSDGFNEEGSALALGSAPRLRDFAVNYRVEPRMSEREFAGQAKKIEDTFLDRLLADGIDLDPLQVSGGNLRATFDEKSQLAKIDFSLMEQASAMDRFMRSDGEFFDDPASIERFVDSVERCSIWCDATPNCHVISYYSSSKRCSLHRIQAYQGHFVQTNGCTTYWQFSVLERKYKFITSYKAELSQRIEDANDDGLDFSITNSGTRAMFRFWPVSLDETTPKTSSEALGELLGDQEPIEKGLTYRIVKKDHALTRGEQEHTETRAQCLKVCARRRILLCSHCFDTGTCWLARLNGSSTMQDFNGSLGASRADQNCLIWSVNFEAEFQRFDRTRPPKRHLRKLDNISAALCAATCRLSHKDQELDCLSFDYCAASASCYLQSTHVVMDYFDESIMASDDDTTVASIETGEPICAHYSRHLEADYRRLADTHFKRHQSLAYGAASFETCAIMCRRGESCAAFEYCEQKRKCYIARREMLDQLEELEPMIGCSIYVPIRLHDELNAELQAGRANLAHANYPSSVVMPLRASSVITGSCWIVTSLLVGLVARLCWTRVGRLGAFASR